MSMKTKIDQYFNVLEKSIITVKMVFTIEIIAFIILIFTLMDFIAFTLILAIIVFIYNIFILTILNGQASLCKMCLEHEDKLDGLYIDINSLQYTCNNDGDLSKIKNNNIEENKVVFHELKVPFDCTLTEPKVIYYQLKRQNDSSFSEWEIITLYVIFKLLTYVNELNNTDEIKSIIKKRTYNNYIIFSSKFENFMDKINECNDLSSIQKHINAYLYEISSIISFE